MNKKQREQRDTPIVDGDARPDMPIDPEKENRRSKKDPDKSSADDKFESERNSDINSLEDYKDAKE